jgi:hypothetical protein
MYSLPLLSFIMKRNPFIHDIKNEVNKCSLKSNGSTALNTLTDLFAVGFKVVRTSMILETVNRLAYHGERILKIYT